MVYVAIIHAAFVSGTIAFFGQTYAQCIRDRSEAEARFRFELTRLRENAESVAFLGGEQEEKKLLDGYLGLLASAWTRYAKTWSQMSWVTYTNGLIAPILPLLIMTPKYLAGEATLGMMVQTATAFGVFQGALNWFSTNFARLSEWYAAASRVTELLSFIDSASVTRTTSQIDVIEGNEGVLRLTNVSVARHDGSVVIADTNLVITPGEMVLVNGDSGAGKSTLVRAIAGLWPWGSGQISLPQGVKTAFLPQRSYIPNGTLRAALTYPGSNSDVTDDTIFSALDLTGLSHLRHLLDIDRPWEKFLSGGEQQRIAFARLLIQRPTLVFLDEATSALDIVNEAKMMELFTHYLFSTTVISVAHRPSLAAFHNRFITVRLGGRGSGLEAGASTTGVQHKIRRALVAISPKKF
jgi:vitamin B12/bleomycin/antimicrobial peptide transport system ATP-binding/permease protein